jgi:hypothetical protein
MTFKKNGTRGHAVSSLRDKLRDRERVGQRCFGRWRSKRRIEKWRASLRSQASIALAVDKYVASLRRYEDGRVTLN